MLHRRLHTIVLYLLNRMLPSMVLRAGHTDRPPRTDGVESPATLNACCVCYTDKDKSGVLEGAELETLCKHLVIAAHESQVELLKMDAARGRDTQVLQHSISLMFDAKLELIKDTKHSTVQTDFLKRVRPPTRPERHELVCVFLCFASEMNLNPSS